MIRHLDSEIGVGRYLLAVVHLRTASSLVLASARPAGVLEPTGLLLETLPWLQSDILASHPTLL